MKEIYSVIHKAIALSALTAMAFQLSFLVIFQTNDCKNNCSCTCAAEEAEAASVSYSDCCSSQKVIKTKKGCCDKDTGSHETHLTSSKEKNLRNLTCDLRTSVFKNNILEKLSGIIHEEHSSPVDIVYFIFKPPIA